MYLYILRIALTHRFFSDFLNNLLILYFFFQNVRQLLSRFLRGPTLWRTLLASWLRGKSREAYRNAILTHQPCLTWLIFAKSRTASQQLHEDNATDKDSCSINVSTVNFNPGNSASYFLLTSASETVTSSSNTVAGALCSEDTCYQQPTVTHALVSEDVYLDQSDNVPFNCTGEFDINEAAKRLFMTASISPDENAKQGQEKKEETFEGENHPIPTLEWSSMRSTQQQRKAWHSPESSANWGRCSPSSRAATPAERTPSDTTYHIRPALWKEVDVPNQTAMETCSI